MESGKTGMGRVFMSGCGRDRYLKENILYFEIMKYILDGVFKFKGNYAH